MQSLNYHHLLYFWLAAKKGGVTAAARELNLAQPTISGQIRQLETTLGAQLFTRAGRGLQLTETGRTVYAYADEIFSIGDDLMSALNGALNRPAQLVIGVAPGVPRLMVARLLEAQLAEEGAPKLIIQSASIAVLTEGLKVHSIDAALMDTPPDARDHARAYAHLLGESPVALFGSKELAEAHRRSGDSELERLAQLPLLLPHAESGLRRQLDAWFAHNQVTPRVVAEVDDLDLMPLLARSGIAAVAAAEAEEGELARLFGLRKLSRLGSLASKYWLIAVERRFRHGVLNTLSQVAQSYLHPTTAAAE